MLLDGRDVRDIPDTELRKEIAWVQQEPPLVRCGVPTFAPATSTSGEASGRILSGVPTC